MNGFLVEFKQNDIVKQGVIKDTILKRDPFYKMVFSYYVIFVEGEMKLYYLECSNVTKVINSNYNKERTI